MRYSLTETIRGLTENKPERTRPRETQKGRWEAQTRADVKRMEVKNVKETVVSREKFDKIVRKDKSYLPR